MLSFNLDQRRARVARRRVVLALSGMVWLSLSNSLLGTQPRPTAPDAAHAAETPLSLADVLATAARANPRIAASRAQARAAAARVTSASRAPDPQLQLGFMNYALPRLAPMPVLGMAQLQVMQMLPLGGKLRVAGMAAAATASASLARADDVVWEIRSQAAMTFFDLAAAYTQLDVARETLRLLHDVAQTAEAMYRVGDGKQADVLRAQLEVSRMTEDTMRMDAMRLALSARLNALLNRNEDEVLGVPLLPRFPEEPPTRDWLRTVADRERPMVRAGEDEVRAADANARLMRKELLPDVQIGVQYGQRAGAMSADATEEMSRRSTERMGSIMLGASVPVFARSRQLRRRDEAAAMADMARADLITLRAETRGRIGEVYASLTSARRLAALYRTTVLPQAEATAQSALSAYRVGSVDFMTVLDARMSVNRYRQALAAVVADEGRAWAELEMLTARELVVHVDATNNGTIGRSRHLLPHLLPLPVPQP
jgi:outer membrane protein TolC